MKLRFFATPQQFRSWLEKYHAKEDELWVGFYKKETGKPSITWSEAVDVALCFGWIDGIRKKVDEQSYTNRFTPRRAGSNWSSINIKKVESLQKLGLMHPAGLKAFNERKREKAGYSYEERKTIVLDPILEKDFRANKKAWQFFQDQPPSYRYLILFWIMSAKQPETRRRRLDRLLEASAKNTRL